MSVETYKTHGDLFVKREHVYFQIPADSSVERYTMDEDNKEVSLDPINGNLIKEKDYLKVIKIAGLKNLPNLFRFDVFNNEIAKTYKGKFIRFVDASQYLPYNTSIDRYSYDYNRYNHSRLNKEMSKNGFGDYILYNDFYNFILSEGEDSVNAKEINMENNNTIKESVMKLKRYSVIQEDNRYYMLGASDGKWVDVADLDKIPLLPSSTRYSLIKTHDYYGSGGLVKDDKGQFVTFESVLLYLLDNKKEVIEEDTKNNKRDVSESLLSLIESIAELDSEEASTSDKVILINDLMDMSSSLYKDNPIAKEIVRVSKKVLYKITLL